MSTIALLALLVGASLVTAGPAVAATCSGVSVPPVEGHLATAVAANPPGTTFCIQAGIHYGTQVKPKDGNRFIGEPGAILSGAKVLDPANAVLEGNHWVWHNQEQQGFENGEIEPLGNEQDRHPEELFVDGVRLDQAPTEAAMGPGQWFFDHDNDEIHIHDNPDGHLIETSVMEFAIAPVWWEYASAAEYPDDVVIENLVVEKYASPGAFGAIGAQAAGLNASDSWVVRHVEARLNHGCGIRLTNGGLLEHSLIHNNGQIGLCGGAFGAEAPLPSIVRNNEIHSNKVLDYNWGWEGGAMKLAGFEDVTFEHNWLHDNDGPGVWFDISNRDVTIRSNLVENNSATGIFYEISYGDTDIYWNQIWDNGHGEAFNDFGAGVQVSNSDGDHDDDGNGWIEIYENAIDGNRFGILAHDEGVDALGTADTDNRRNHDDEAINLQRYWAHDNEIRAEVEHQWVHQIKVDDPSTSNVVIDGNTYFVDSQQSDLWFTSINNDPVEGTNFNEWRANGWDVNGTTVGYASGTPALPGHAVPFQLAVYGPVQGCDGVLVPAQAGQLATLVAANPPSTTFCLAPGIHYETQVEPKDGNRFIGEPGAILSGAKVLDPAQAVHHFGDIYYWEGQTQEGFSNGQIISGGNDRDLHPEELFVNGDTRYRHVEAVLPYHDADKDPALDWVDEPGEWFFDYEADRIYIYGNPAGSLIETSVKEFAIAPVWWNYASAADYPDDVVIENLVVEKYANPGQFGAIGAQAHGANGSDSWTLRHVEVRYTHACGVRLVNGGTIENASIHHNGQIGVCGSGDGDEASLPVTIVDSEVRDNRVLDFNPTWEGGGVKLVHFGDASVANTAVVGNAGPGFISHEVESLDFLRNLVSGNSHTPVAIRHTPTGSAVVHRNQILDNGIESVGDEGAGVEIRHHGSTTGLVTTAITENLIDGNRWGLFAPDVDGTNHAYTATDNVIRAADPGHWVHQIRHTTSSAPNTVVDRNTYHVTSQSDTRWFYGAAGQPLSGMNFATWPYDGMGSTATFGTAPQMPVGGEAYQAAAYGPRLRAL